MIFRAPRLARPESDVNGSTNMTITASTSRREAGPQPGACVDFGSPLSLFEFQG